MHIGKYIESFIISKNISLYEIKNKYGLSEKKILQIINSESLETKILFKISKIFEHDFFSYLSKDLRNDQISLIEFNEYNSMVSSNLKNDKKLKQTILNDYKTNKGPILRLSKKYNVPKTTLYKLLKDYK